MGDKPMDCHCAANAQNEKEECVRELRALSAWIAGLSYRDIPEDVLHHARRVFIDDLGSAIGGTGEHETKTLQAMLSRGKSSGGSTILCRGFPKTDLFSAAEINGMAGCCLELDEGFGLAISHAGLYTVPGLLALAEDVDATVAGFLTALVAGYEVGARLGEAWEFKPVTIHPHGVFVGVALAAAGAKLLGADAEGVFAALTTAAALTVASPFDQATYGALIRNAWSGVGASLGLKALFFARDGVLGLPETVYSTFHDVYCADYMPGRFGNGLGERWAIGYGFHKAYACCHGAHSALDALLAIHSRLNAPKETPEAILVETHEEGMTLPDANPTTTLGAKFSLPHAAAAAWLLGTGGKDAFTADTLANPEIVELRKRVELRELDAADYPDCMGPCRVTVVFADGRRESEFVECATGDAPKPITDAMLFAKFSETTRGVLPEGEGLAEAIFALPPTAKVAQITDMLRKKSL